MRAQSFAIGLTMLSGGLGLGCEPGALPEAKVIGESSGAFVVFPVATGENPAKGISGSAKATEAPAGQMTLELTVRGMPAKAAHGAHLHIKACDDGPDGMKGGGHYQHEAFPEGGMATDEKYANKDNEAWLDFMTDDKGAARAFATVKWLPASDKAKSIIVHAMPTGKGGVAGPRLACLPMAFK